MVEVKGQANVTGRKTLLKRAATFHITYKFPVKDMMIIKYCDSFNISLLSWDIKESGKHT